MVDLERQIETLIEESKMVAEFLKFINKIIYKEKIKELILKEAIRTVYQPIVDLEKFSILGFEALTRGPKGECPDMLFEIARELDMGFELDSLCRKAAFSHAKSMNKTQMIFVNSQPNSMADPELRGNF
jgi:EAL domain-containing protein (putative c-di-GMP-specific phosphodiesterase class I)